MVDWLASIWGSLPTDLRPSIFNGLVALTTTVVGVLVVFWQIGRQANNAVRQNRHTEALKLKMKVYQDIVELSRKAMRDEVDFSSYVGSYTMDLKLYRDFTSQGLSWSIPKARSAELIDRKSAFGNSEIELLSIIERWSIIDHRIDIFRTAFNAAQYDIEEAYEAYFKLAVRTMPQENPGAQGTLFPWSLPNNQVIDEIETKGRYLQECIQIMGNYLFDFQVEMQNLLLGEMFQSRLQARKPIDPQYIVVKLARHRKLRRHFNTQTAWGRNKTKVENSVRAQFSNVGWRRFFS